MKTALLWRFSLVLSHGFITSLLYTQRYYNVIASLEADSVNGYVREMTELTRSGRFAMEYFKRDNTFAWLLAIAVILNAVEILLLSFGHPLAIFPNLVAGALHLCGLTVTIQMIFSAWPADVYFVVFILSAVVPLVIAFAYAVDLLVFQSSLLRRIDVRI